MTRSRRRYLGLATCIIAACGGSSVWETACGCGKATENLALDLQIPDPYAYSFEQPDTLQQVHDRVWRKLLEQNEPVSLGSVRAIGRTFDESCVRRSVEVYVRCTFWLWHRPNELRGIEVTVTPHEELALPTDHVAVKYVSGNW